MEYTILVIECSDGRVLFLVVDSVDRSVSWTTDINFATRLSAQTALDYVRLIKDHSVDRPALAQTLTERRYTPTDEVIYSLK